MKSKQKVYLDCFSGIAGDMFLGALVDAGLPIDELRAFFAPMGIPDLSLTPNKVMRQGLEATKLDVDIDEGHHHHEHENGHDHHHHGRTFKEIQHYLKHQKVNEEIFNAAIRVFHRIALAESKAHGKPIEELHFHEVGAWDAIVDVLGTLWGIRRLGIEDIRCSAVNVGGGFVEFSHGKYPVPAPATANILQEAGIPFYMTPDVGEMLTPTGAALLAETVSEFAPPTGMVANRIAYGAGTKQTATTPNVIRMIFYAQEVTSNEIVQLETNIDDMNPEFCEYTMDRLLEAGAVDVFITPVIMKKSRPGFKLTVLSPLEKEADLTKIVLTETSTFGVRKVRMSRDILERESVVVETPFGKVRVKKGSGMACKSVPEYEDCVNLARAKGVPLRDVYSAAEKAADSND